MLVSSIIIKLIINLISW